jgi:ABC-type multidrug transport system fused ATPase/permease subunit
VKRTDPHQRGLIFRFYRECVRPYLGLQAEIGICLLVGVALHLIDPILLKVIIDRALGDSDFSLLVILVAVLGVVLIFRVAFHLVSVWLYSYSGLRILFDLRQRVFQHIERLSLFFFRGERTGDILARLTYDIDVLQQAAAHTVVNAVQDILTLIGIFTILFWLDPVLTLVLLAVYPLLGFILARINGLVRNESGKAREAISDLFSFLDERLGGMRLVQEYRREKTEARRHVRVSRPWIAANLRLSVLGAWQISIADLMSTGAFMLVFLLGGARAISGALSVGSLVAFYALAVRLYRPVSGLIDINISLQVARASLARVYELLDSPPEIEEAADATIPDRIAGEIRIENVSLTWPDGTRGLDGINLFIGPGQVVAFVGSSGGGKSTLAALLGRYIDPNSGTVTVDGLDVRRWKLSDLRGTIGLVPQETQLFHDTLAANLRMAQPRASDETLIDSLEAAGLGQFLKALPEGLGTIVGEHGMRLSGGERQRLALARALLKDPMIHVLDETTSALDTETERKVLERYLDKVRGRTVILIAHRLTSIVDVDRIFVLDQGRVVEAGTHDELYGADGLYRRLFDFQLRKPENRRDPKPITD